MNLIRAIKVNAPINAGDVLMRDICGTGVNIVAARSIPQIKKQEVS
jgi:CxxC motif-containing protein